MHSIWKTSLRYTIFSFLLFGLVYPLALTGVAERLFPHKADGSLIVRNGEVIGSKLLAQGFTSDRYFHPRPSAAGNGYDAAESGASNLAQSNAILVHREQADVDKLRKENPGVPVPEDLVTASASGLDPDITPDAAYFQALRVAKARGWSVDVVRALIAEHTVGRTFGLLGEPRVNVLELNLVLDSRDPHKAVSVIP
ncbi:MAG: potassium-transporting ATPase subunit KdpC [Acidobacteriota bacterium]|nr:potassium-transporting ATPase subunit KdpC [Acidobacteriota bacterium]